MKIGNSDTLKGKIFERLSSVLDPETGMDVMRMELVQNLSVDDEGNVVYQFRPSSPLCPLAAPLALDIIQAIKEVLGTAKQAITVVDYIQADQLNIVLKKFVDN
jgi:metal-sulfur cluster biosynthetic enzyme